MVAVLVAAGTMGGMALFLADMNRQQHVAQKKAETRVEIVALSERINSILSSKNACKKTLIGSSPPPNIAMGTSVSVNALKNDEGQNVLEQGKTYGNRLVKIASMKLKVEPPASIVGTNVKDSIFEVVFERVSKAYTGEKELAKSFSLSLKLNSASRLAECHATFGSVSMNVKQKFCIQVGGSWSNGKCSNIVRKICDGFGGSGTFNSSSGNCSAVIANLRTKIDNHDAAVTGVHGGRIQDNTDALGNKAHKDHTTHGPAPADLP